MWKVFIMRDGGEQRPPTSGNYSQNHGGGHFVRRADGKILVAYTSNWNVEGTNYWFAPVGGINTVMLSVVDRLGQLFYTANATADNEWLFKTLDTGGTAYNAAYFLKVPNVNPDLPDSILLFIYYRDFFTKGRVECYRSLNGLGTDFSLLSTITTTNFGGDKFLGPSNIGTLPIYLDDVGDHGRIIVPYVRDRMVTGHGVYTDLAFALSDNRGASWTTPAMPRGGTTMIGHRLSGPRGLAVFGELGNRQLVAAFSNSYGQGYVRYTMSQDDGLTWSRLSGEVCSECGGAGCGDCAGADIPAMPSQRNYLYIGSLSGHIWHYGTRVFNGHEDDEYNYMLSSYVSDDQSHGSRWWLFRRPKSSLLSTEEMPNPSGWEGPLHPDMKGDDGNENYWGMPGDYPGQHIHIAAGTSHAWGGSISYGYQAGNFKFAIAGIYDGVIRSTFPNIIMMIVYHADINSGDTLHFKLKSSKEEVDSQLNPERFGYSMNGGSTWIKFPASGVSGINPYNLLVACNIEVPPGTRASLTPYAKVMVGAGGSDNWWNIFDNYSGRSDWWNIGLGEEEKAETWDTIFEHEVEGI